MTRPETKSNFEGRVFFYDERVEHYVTPTIYVVPSESAAGEINPQVEAAA